MTTLRSNPRLSRFQTKSTEPEPSTSRTSGLRLIGQISIGLAVLLAPWLLGAVEAVMQWWLFVGVLLSLLCYVGICLTSRQVEMTPLSTVLLPLLIATAQRFPLTPLVYGLIALHALILMYGGHYTYALAPLGEWLRGTFDFSRNHRAYLNALPAP